MTFDQVKVGDWFEHRTTGWIGQVHCFTGPDSAMIRLENREWILPDRAAIGLLPIRALDMTETCLAQGLWTKVEEPPEVAERNRLANEARQLDTHSMGDLVREIIKEIKVSE